MSEAPLHHRLSEPDRALLRQLRQAQAIRTPPHLRRRSVGERISDAVAANVGSWPFIIVQSALLLAWIAANALSGTGGILGGISAWDPYPFILLNLVLSFQAAYTAPIIMMAQNRQAAIDRLHAEHDYKVNIKAELEIELLHQKLDQLRDKEIAVLTKTVDSLSASLREALDILEADRKK